MVTVPPKSGETSYKAVSTGTRAAAEANQALAEAKSGTDVSFCSGSEYHPQGASASASTRKEKGAMTTR